MLNWPSTLCQATDGYDNASRLASVSDGANRAQHKILRREDFFFVAFVCFCKPLRAKQKATKVTKGGKRRCQIIWLYHVPP